MDITIRQSLRIFFCAVALFALMVQPSLADCKFSGGKIFSLTKEINQPMQVLTTFSGSGNWWLFETNNKIMQNMLISAFFNKKRIYITGNKPKCQIQRIVKFGSATPKLGGQIKRLFAL